MLYVIRLYIIINELKLKPYKCQSGHQLHALDYEKWVSFAQWWLGLRADFHRWLIATDEAYFYLTESINKQNNLLWLTERPEDWIEKPLHFFLTSFNMVFVNFYKKKLFGFKVSKKE
jgi:hypothetical protein